VERRRPDPDYYPLPPLKLLWPSDVRGRLRPWLKYKPPHRPSAAPEAPLVRHYFQSLRGLELGGSELLRRLGRRLEKDCRRFLRSLPPADCEWTRRTAFGKNQRHRRHLRRLKLLQQQLLLGVLNPALALLEDGLICYPWWRKRGQRHLRRLAPLRRRLELLYLRLEVAPRRLSQPLLRRLSDLAPLLSAFWRFRQRLEHHTRQWERLNRRCLERLPANRSYGEFCRHANSLWQERSRLGRRGKWLLPRCGLWRRRLLGLVSSLPQQPW
jgi:hypothetical protein